MEPQPNDFWYTPPDLMQKVGQYFNDRFFDPCPADPDFNGLNTFWPSSCFINPPYSRDLKRAFIDAASNRFEAEAGDDYIWLLNFSSSTDMQRIKEKATAICLPNGRIHFTPGHPDLMKDKNGNIRSKVDSPRYDSIIALWGGDPARFCEIFSEVGTCFVAGGGHGA